jgi:hypothetical protein
MDCKHLYVDTELDREGRNVDTYLYNEKPISQTEVQQEKYHEIKHTRQRRRQDASSEG